MNLVEYAKSELQELYGEDYKDDPYGGMVSEAVLELIEKFSEQGHSGSSAPIVLGVFKKLASFEPITPILDVASQWSEVSDGVFQHKKLCGLFKKDENGKPYYIDAIVMRLPDGTCWSGSFFAHKEDIGDESKRISGAAYVKEFPFAPKTFYINVNEDEVTKDDYVRYCINANQLEGAMGYYDLMNLTIKN